MALSAVMSPWKPVAICSLCWSVFFFVSLGYYFAASFTQIGLQYSTEHHIWDGVPRRVNALATDYDPYLNKSIHDAIATGASPQDPRVVNLVRKLLDPPSERMIKLARRVVKTPQTEAVEKILRNKVHTRYTVALLFKIAPRI